MIEVTPGKFGPVILVGLCVTLNSMSSENRTFQDHFSALAAGYSKFRPGYSSELFKYLSSLTPGNALAWDCATGNGQAAVALADIFDAVIATDASSKQIEQAQMHPAVEYRVAVAEDSGLKAASIDLVTVAQALHWFDIPRFMQEAKRVLKPDGILAVWTYNLFRINHEIDAIVDDLYWNTLNGYWAEERKMVDAGYAGLIMPFEQLSPPQFAMTARWSLEQVLGYLGTWSAVRKYRESNEHDLIEDVAARLQPAWGEAALEKAISWPLSLRIGINR